MNWKDKNQIGISFDSFLYWRQIGWIQSQRRGIFVWLGKSACVSIRKYLSSPPSKVFGRKKIVSKQRITYWAANCNPASENWIAKFETTTLYIIILFTLMMHKIFKSLHESQRSIDELIAAGWVNQNNYFTLLFLAR